MMCGFSVCLGGLEKYGIEAYRGVPVLLGLIERAFLVSGAVREVVCLIWWARVGFALKSACEVESLTS
jgi:hypothetical protein